MAQPKVLILSGNGINCEEETQRAFELAGGKVDIAHLQDLIDGHRDLGDYQIFVFPGGFSYGDDTGSGKALGHRVKNELGDQLLDYAQSDSLILGVCNGFQVLTQMGLLPGLPSPGVIEYRPEVALVHNNSARYMCRWVDLDFTGNGPWLSDLGRRSLPIAHGEGKFYAPDEVLARLKDSGQIAARYVLGELCEHFSLPANPNGSLEDIAGITDQTGRILGMMPHPERAVQFTQLPHWTLLKEQYRREGKELLMEGPGLQLFRNAVGYFK